MPPIKIPRLSEKDKKQIWDKVMLILCDEFGQLKAELEIGKIFTKLENHFPQHIRYFSDSNYNQQKQEWLKNSYPPSNFQIISSMPHIEVADWPHWQKCACRDFSYSWTWAFHDKYLKFNLQLHGLEHPLIIVFDLDKHSEIIKVIREVPLFILTANINTINPINLLTGKAQGLMIEKAIDSLLNLVDFHEIKTLVEKEINNRLN